MTLAGGDMSVASRRGMILVSVLWLLVFLGGLAIVLRLHMSGVVASVRATEDKAAVRILAEAGIAYGAALVRAGPPGGLGQLADQLTDSVTTATGTVSITISNEALRVDINTAPEPLLIGVLRASGAADNLAETLAERIVERRGRQVGSEGGEPPGQSQRVAARFRSTAEIAGMKEMPEEIAIALERYMTVSSGLEGVRLVGLDDKLLAKIPGLPRSVATAVGDYRSGRITYRQFETLLTGVEYNTNEKALSWRARLQVDLASGYSETLEALVIISPDDDAPYRIIDWRRLNEVD